MVLLANVKFFIHSIVIKLALVDTVLSYISRKEETSTEITINDWENTKPSSCGYFHIPGHNQ